MILVNLRKTKTKHQNNDNFFEIYLKMREIQII